jgi:hypothetical protein
MIKSKKGMVGVVGSIFMTPFGITLRGLDRGQSREQVYETQVVVEKCSKIDWCPFCHQHKPFFVGLYMCVNSAGGD